MDEKLFSNSIRILRCSIRLGVILVLLLNFGSIQAQIRVPNMLVPNDSWGLIDANNIYGGCMQVDTRRKMLETDVQFLKRGMIFVVYDDDSITPGPQTRLYLFQPKLTGSKSWKYNTPFEIPQVKQNNNIINAGLMNYLVPLNIGVNTDPASKTNVYYDSTNNNFYKYDESIADSTKRYVVIYPSAMNISVKKGYGIADSTNVQNALQDLHTKIDANTQRKDTVVSVAGSLSYNIGFALKQNSMVFYNGTLLDYPSQWSFDPASATYLTLLVGTEVFDRIKVQR